jgi:PQQ-like domain
VLITVCCPRCGSRFNLKPELRGQKMRCPNPICREVFEVRELEPEQPAADGAKTEAAPPAEKLDSARKPPATEKTYVAGAVGEIVPFLASESVEVPAEEAAPAAAPVAPLLPAEPAAEAPAPPEAPTWHQAPPPVRRAAPTKPPTATPPKPPTATPTADKKPVPTRETRPPQVDKKAEPAPAKAPNWREQAPPPVRTAQSPKAKETLQAVPKRSSGADTAVTPRLPAADTKEMPPGTWQPPPVRQPAQPPEAPEEPAAAASDLNYVPATRRTARWAIPAMVIFVLGVGGVAAWFVVGHQKETEEQLVQKAKEAYENGTYTAAVKLYDDVLKNFPDSERAPEYRFWKDFSQTRHQVKSFDVEWKPALEQLRAFLAKYKDDPLLKSHKPDVWDCYRKLLDQKMLPPAEQKLSKDNHAAVKQAIADAELVETEAEKFVDDDIESAELKKRFAKANAGMLRFEAVQELIAIVEGMKEPTWADIENVSAHELAGEPEVRPLIEKLRGDWLFKGNPYEPAAGGRVLYPPPLEDSGLPVVPRVDGSGTGTRGSGVVLALARGVLYALAESDGRLLWWTRVGIDTTTLPVRLPAGETNPEVVLVLSSDSNTLTARVAQTGAALWRYDLGAPCLGRPVIVGRRAYVATTVKVPQADGQAREEGRVHEIEIVRGHVLGWFRLGLPLTGSGARQPATNLLYFPADRGYLYVLDVDKRQCVAMLYTGHPSGSLRGEPVLVSDDLPTPSAGVAAGPPRYLVLSQAAGLDGMKLRAWRLPLEKVVQTPPLQPEPHVRGWSWFPPHCDGEKIVFATDAGILGLYGINQYHNTDPPLFPLFPQAVQLQGNSAQPGRAQVVHATESDFWALARGRLQHWRMGLAAEGLKVAAVWKEPLELGSPLHAAQVSDAGDTLFVVTQSPARQACLATAVDAATGQVRWQRQLGLSCQGDPALIGTRVAALDQSGSLFVFDAERKDPLLPVERGNVRGTGSWLLPGEDGQSVYALSIPGPGRFAIRRFGPSKAPGDNQPREFNFPAPLAGTPALGAGSLVLPLADGMLARVSLKASSKEGVDRGPHWRAAHADADALGHVVFLVGDEFLVTDGSRRLLRVRWPAASTGQSWDPITVKAELDDRIVAAPLVVSPATAPVARVVVADSAGNLLLLQLQGKEIKEVRRWALGGKITADPFLRGNRVGCIIDRRQLVWIDPASDQPAWTLTVEGEAIVGQPQQVGELVVIADLAGKFISVDRQTGKRVGPGYVLRASVAPAAAPVMFGPDRLLAPLSDGTMLLLPIKQPEK